MEGATKLMQHDAPSARERKLASELRLLRGTVGLHGKDVADQLGWSPSKISRIENNRIGVAAEDLELLLEFYKVPEERSDYLRKLAASARTRGWWDAYANALSSGFSSLIKLEAGSSVLRCYSAVVPHALLQTSGYARQIITSTLQAPAPAEVDRRVDITRRRQQVLKREKHPMRVAAVIDEAIFQRLIWTPDGRTADGIMRGQFEQLAQMATWPNVTIQVLRFEAGLPPVTSGSFSILDSLATGTADVVYLENKTRAFFIDTEREVHQYVQEFELLSSMALDPDASLDFIQQAVRG
ncbi:helix-turn-helix domain-containing protein [Lentzea alba]|uniref:helix-turn-helix domain-containing protein n=1 Tax=Lentzea alba TaxID=2714351 RepID=UPI0039BEDCF1